MVTAEFDNPDGTGRYNGVAATFCNNGQKKRCFKCLVLAEKPAELLFSISCR